MKIKIDIETVMAQTVMRGIKSKKFQKSLNRNWKLMDYIRFSNHRLQQKGQMKIFFMLFFRFRKIENRVNLKKSSYFKNYFLLSVQSLLE